MRRHGKESVAEVLRINPVLFNQLAESLKRNAGYQRNAIPNRRDDGMHPLVRSLSLELPPFGGKDAGARRVCRPLCGLLIQRP